MKETLGPPLRAAAITSFITGVALLLLYATYRAAASWLAREPHPVLSVLWVRFLDAPTALLVPLAGLVAGFIGSVLSLSRRD